MTDVETMDGPGANPARRRKAATVTATDLGAHLDMTRQRVSAMVDEGIIRREPDGRFIETECRVLYLRWLRDPARRAVKSAAETKFLEQRTMALEIRNLQKLGKLVPSEVLEETVDIVTGLFRQELASLPTAYSRDIPERRRLEGLIHAMLKRIANEAFKRSERIAATLGTGRAEAHGLETTDADA